MSQKTEFSHTIRYIDLILKALTPGFTQYLTIIRFQIMRRKCGKDPLLLSSKLLQSCSCSARVHMCSQVVVTCAAVELSEFNFDRAANLK
jgi:hypothetical protein